MGELAPKWLALDTGEAMAKFSVVTFWNPKESAETNLLKFVHQCAALRVLLRDAKTGSDIINCSIGTLIELGLSRPAANDNDVAAPVEPRKIIA
jgi:hypothetical protein